MTGRTRRSGARCFTVTLSWLRPPNKHPVSVVTLQPDTSVIVVNNPEGGGEAAEVDEAVEVSVEDEEGELEVVQPSEEWQTLRPGESLKEPCREAALTFSLDLCLCVCVWSGQAVPAGSHVRLNLQTGQQEVRLGEEQLKYWTHTHRFGSRGGG